MRSEIQRFVGDDPALRWALRRAPRPSLRWRIEDGLHALAGAALLALAAPLVLLLLPLYLIVLRRHERADPAPHVRPSLEHAERLAALEDFGAQNQFTAIGYVKPGELRRLTIRAVLWLIDYSARHVFERGSLAGVKTIHFARWTSLDDFRRVIFTSNYDGSLEGYNDDFIDKVAYGLNASFSNGVGYPRTTVPPLRGRPARAGVQGLPAPPSDPDAGLLLGLRPAERGQHREQRPDPLRAARQTRSGGDRGLAAAAVGRERMRRATIDRADIQGLIVRGHGTLRAARYRARPDRRARRREDMARRESQTTLTTAATVRRQSAVNVALTPSGLRKLGLPAATLGMFSREFTGGMTTEHRRRILGDVERERSRALELGRPAAARKSTFCCFSTPPTRPR